MFLCCSDISLHGLFCLDPRLLTDIMVDVNDSFNRRNSSLVEIKSNFVKVYEALFIVLMDLNLFLFSRLARSFPSSVDVPTFDEVLKKKDFGLTKGQLDDFLKHFPSFLEAICPSDKPNERTPLLRSLFDAYSLFRDLFRLKRAEKLDLPTAPKPHQGTQGKRAVFLDNSGTQGVRVELTGK